LPTVPRYNKAPLEQQPMPGVRVQPVADAEAFGGGPSAQQASSAINQVSDNAIELIARERQKAEAIDLDAKKVQISQLQGQLQLDAMSMKGRNAAGAPDQALQAWTKGTAAIRDSKQSPEARAKLNNILGESWNELNRHIQVHVEGEFKAYDAETNKSNLSAAHARIMSNYNDAASVAKGFQDLATGIEDYGIRNGESPETRESKVRQAYADAHGNIVTQMTNDQQFDQADTYLKTHAGAFSADVSKTLQGQILAGRTRAEKAQAEAQDRFENQMFMRAIPGAKDPLTMTELGEHFRSERIDHATYTLLANRLTKTNDDPEIPNEEKVAKQYEVFKLWEELLGKGSIDPLTGEPQIPAQGLTLKQNKRLRSAILDAGPAMSDAMEQRLLIYSQENFNNPDSGIVKAKVAWFTHVANWFKEKFGKKANKDELASAMNLVLDDMKSNVPLSKMAEDVEFIKQKTIIANNPNRTKYPIGTHATNQNGLSGVVIGHDDIGDPIWDWAKK
jgi:hypothetical protein